MRLLLCGLGSMAAVALVRSQARRRSILDHPNARSAHERPTPRLGGIGIIVVFLGSALGLGSSAVAGALPVLVGTGVVSILGLVDDLRPLPARVRFGVQALAATGVVAARWEALGSAVATVSLPSWLLGPAFVLWVVWMTNLYNFMDGIDGLAAGQTILACLGLAAWMAGAGSGNPVLLLLLATASAGFLLFNFPPATIFMGDVGSTAIGFFLATVPLLPASRPVPLEAVWVAVGLFILDATTTLVRRLRNGERWYEAHRSHWYQRPLRHGFAHRTITLWAYAGMLLLALASAALAQVGPALHALLLAAPAIVFLPAVLAVRRVEGSPDPAPLRERP
ncbi:MAG: glycosyltransferase family 4 protein [Deltaproteobacteria bacterium]|nr:glycosyltransferase family 4 protein [Deltaproteobacteria bacterium]